MPIPHFADHGALPPFTAGDPISPETRSPYRATMQELVDRFCTSANRAKLLKGLNAYRKHLFSGGFLSGYQWVDGSFVENVEKTRGRSPSDIDVVTLFNRPLKYQVNGDKWNDDYEASVFGSYFDTQKMKPAFQCDTYSIDLDAGARALIRNSTYWFGLFSDMRGAGGKKGIVEIPLAVDPMEFAAIDQLLGGKFDV